MPYPLADKKAAYRRSNPHPKHAALASALSAIGLPFECEKKIIRFYADFCFPSLGLIVEIDGAQHDPERDKNRDDILKLADYEVLRLPSTLNTAETVSRIMAWVGRNAQLCHHCRQEPKTGVRYCRACSEEKQDSYRVKQLGLPPRGPKAEKKERQLEVHGQGQYYLYPECKECGDSGWKVIATPRGDFAIRCACRQKPPQVFLSELERDKAISARYRPTNPEASLVVDGIVGKLAEGKAIA